MQYRDVKSRNMGPGTVVINTAGVVSWGCQMVMRLFWLHVQKGETYPALAPILLIPSSAYPSNLSPLSEAPNEYIFKNSYYTYITILQCIW
jgi:hypothetical protein